ncbi:MAG: FkbM family methyltransferase [Verrucomicrobia bacterium]|nr:FkbM family methyltransferase [Verrucomicrobiota bacterium]
MSKNRIEELVFMYKDKQLEKYDYIDKMQTYNKTLFYLSERIKNTDIEKIEILDDMLLFTTRQDNIKLAFNGLDRRCVPFDIINFSYYEKEDEKVLFNIIEDDAVIFDIGANIGWYSLLFSKRLPKAKIFTFEPIENTYKYLITNLTLNAATNVIPFNFGLSDKEGSSSYYFFPEGSVLASEKNLINCPKAQEVRCKVDKLDRFLIDHKLDRIDLIKCDVEGAELSVLSGGINTIKTFLPIIFIELFERWSIQFNYHPNDVIHLLNDIGYDCFLANEDKLEPCSAYKETKEERLNFFFLHRKKHRHIIDKLTNTAIAEQLP